MASELATEPPDLKPATNLDEVWEIFDPNLEIDPTSPLYVPRRDHHLRGLEFDLKKARTPLHAFLCGHRGSGKTTELKRLRADSDLLERYVPVYITAAELGTEMVHLTHDALMLGIGRALTKAGEDYGLERDLRSELEEWGRQVVKTFLHDESALAKVGARPDAWFAYFRAQLQSRRTWTQEQREILEPRVQDLLDIVDRIAQCITDKSRKRVLVIVDDLEKGESEAEQEMHRRLFEEQYDVLTQPQFSIVYTLPISFRALPQSRIPKDQIYAFSAARIYEREDKERDQPPLKATLRGYKVMRDFVERRMASPLGLLGDKTLDELIRIGGGLFRETAWAFREAARAALLRGDARIEDEDARTVFHRIKKDYQPSIRGEAVGILQGVLKSREGWVPGVEPFLQSRAVMEYENDQLWLDVRYVLKDYVRGLERDGE